MKFHIVNCLTPSFAQIAKNFGYLRSTHVQSDKLSDYTDFELTEYATRNNFIFVTRDSDYYRARPGTVQHSQCYLGKYNHPGLMCINMPHSAKKKQHQLYFRAALMTFEKYENINNEVIETNWTNDSDELTIGVEVYEFPTVNRNLLIDRYSIQIDGDSLIILSTSI